MLTIQSQFSYALNKFNLRFRYTGYWNHRYGPVGLQADIKNICFITQFGSVGLLTGYQKSIREHYRYCPTGAADRSGTSISLFVVLLI